MKVIVELIESVLADIIKAPSKDRMAVGGSVSPQGPRPPPGLCYHICRSVFVWHEKGIIFPRISAGGKDLGRSEVAR